MESSIDELSLRLSTLRTDSNAIAALDNHSPVSTFILPSMSSCPMATDNYNHLLVYHHQQLILFHLPTFEILFSIPILSFIESSISDICFYPIRNSFLLSSSNTIFSLSSNQHMKIIHKFTHTIWSITQACQYVFICYLFGHSIEQWQLLDMLGVNKNVWLLIVQQV